MCHPCRPGPGLALASRAHQLTAQLGGSEPQPKLQDEGLKLVPLRSRHTYKPSKSTTQKKRSVFRPFLFDPGPGICSHPGESRRLACTPPGTREDKLITGFLGQGAAYLSELRPQALPAARSPTMHQGKGGGTQVYQVQNGTRGRTEHHRGPCGQESQ